MKHDSKQILSILDSCCEAFTFPMLDNGYVYLGATRLSAYRSSDDWAIVIEVFGFSPRAGFPDIQVYTFASRSFDRKKSADFVSAEAYLNYLRNNPNNESEFFYPIQDDWFHDADLEAVPDNATEIHVRGEAIRLPSFADYAQVGIELIAPPQVYIYELCRYLAAQNRHSVLANQAERRVHVFPEMVELLMLDEWHHPDLLNGELPSANETFQQLASVLASGDAHLYSPSLAPNTHWRNWPEGGTL